MKTTIFSKSALLALCLGATLFVTSCDKDDDDIDDQTYEVSGNASGSQESPAVTTSGTGSISGNYDARTNVLNYTITWTGLSGVATAAYFYGPAAAGTNGNVVTTLTITANAAMNGSASGSTTLTDEQETALLSDNMYYNIHTAANVTGEIRGQIHTDDN